MIPCVYSHTLHASGQNHMCKLVHGAMRMKFLDISPQNCAIIVQADPNIFHMIPTMQRKSVKIDNI